MPSDEYRYRTLKHLESDPEISRHELAQAFSTSHRGARVIKMLVTSTQDHA